MVQVLLIGQGSREHALALKISKSPLLTKLHLWPGHLGMATLGEIWKDDSLGELSLASSDFAPLIQLAKRRAIDLIVVGPEAPLSVGIADQAREAGILVFGPQAYAAQLETDKSFAKALMKKAGIPTAFYLIVSGEAETTKKATEMLDAKGGVVIKASGLAAGKGVFVCKTHDEIKAAMQLLFHTEMKQAAQKIVLEEILTGRECSFFVLLGKNSAGASIGQDAPADHVEIGFAVDYKRLHDGDQGPNTGGMGCYTPVPWLPANASDLVMSSVVKPLLRELRSQGSDYVGCLYVGLMWSPTKGPQVIEFNVRFGDPEAQVLSISSPIDWLKAMLELTGFISDEKTSHPDLVPFQGPHLVATTPTSPNCTVGVVMAAPTYPYGKNRGTHAVLPLDLFHVSSENKGIVFGASLVNPVTPPGRPSTIETGAGRVLTVTGQGSNFQLARSQAYSKVSDIRKLWPGAQYRTDIADALDS